MDKLFDKISSEAPLKEKKDRKEMRRSKKHKSNKSKKNRDNDRDNDDEKVNMRFDYYKILGVDSDAKQIEIKRAYKKLLAKYHPDKVENTKENKARYKLITEAARILTNDRKRKAYDFDKKNTEENTDFFGQRDSFKDFLKLQESGMTEEDRRISKLKFEEFKNDVNAKHGYSGKKDEALDIDDYNNRIEDIINSREQEDIDFEQENLFEGREFNSKEFNKMFNKRNNKSKNKNTGITKVDDLMAFNDGDNYAGIDDVDNLYAEGNFDGTNDFAGLDNGLIDLDNGSNISSDEDDDDNESKIPLNEFDEMMKSMMNDRGLEDDKFKNMTDGDFKSAMDNKDSISHNFGFMIGNTITKGKNGIIRGDQQKQKKKYDRDMIDAYKKLTEE